MVKELYILVYNLFYIFPHPLPKMYRGIKQVFELAAGKSVAKLHAWTLLPHLIKDISVELEKLVEL